MGWSVLVTVVRNVVVLVTVRGGNPSTTEVVTVLVVKEVSVGFGRLMYSIPVAAHPVTEGWTEADRYDKLEQLG